MIPTCATIHDLSCYAKSSLTVVCPVLEAMGVEACPLPTAILSTQTDGFDGYAFTDLTATMQSVLHHWQELGICFEGVYSGFLGSPQQIDIVMQFIASQKRCGAPLVVVDPVLGDGGCTYGPMDHQLVAGMRSLVSCADVITPNTTEVSLLLGTPWEPNPSQTLLELQARALSDLGPAKVVVTSAACTDDLTGVAWYDRTTDAFCVHRHRRVSASYPGSGDLFASVLTGSLLGGNTFEQSVLQADAIVASAVARTHAMGYAQRHGICTSSIIGDLVKLRG